MIELLSLPFVQTALLSAFILVGIHTYLGFHIVSRGVIFVDLSLAQSAAFGTAMAIVSGLGRHSLAGYFLSLGFTLLGALVISLSRTKDERVPQEAFIGIIFVAFTAGTILLLSKQAEGTGELNQLLAGSLFTVAPNELIKIALIYSAVGLLHLLLSRRFITISTDRVEAVKRGWKLVWWDFLFYASFGVVVTSSVAIAGVMLVFALLVIPPSAALLLTSRAAPRLAIGWIFGFLGVLIGVLLSLRLDLPAGPAVIVTMVAMLLVIALMLRLRR